MPIPQSLPVMTCKRSIVFDCFNSVKNWALGKRLFVINIWPVSNQAFSSQISRTIAGSLLQIYLPEESSLFSSMCLFLLWVPSMERPSWLTKLCWWITWQCSSTSTRPALKFKLIWADREKSLNKKQEEKYGLSNCIGDSFSSFISGFIFLEWPVVFLAWSLLETLF